MNKNKLNLTDEQKYGICYIIEEWYFIYKNRIANYENRTHCLGHAKEILKEMIVGGPDEK